MPLLQGRCRGQESETANDRFRWDAVALEKAAHEQVALLGVGLYSGCAVILMMLGFYRVEGFNPLSFLIPAIAMAVKSGLFEELVFAACSSARSRRWPAVGSHWSSRRWCSASSIC